jgi:hypothetical protein
VKSPQESSWSAFAVDIPRHGSVERLGFTWYVCTCAKRCKANLRYASEFAEMSYEIMGQLTEIEQKKKVRGDLPDELVISLDAVQWVRTP